MTTKFELQYSLSQLPSLNKYINAERKNRYKGGAIKKKATNYVRIETLSQTVGKPKNIVVVEPLQFDFHLKNSRTDPDNVAFVRKYIFDGWQKAGLISNDNLKTVGCSWTDSFVVDGGDYVTIKFAGEEIKIEKRKARPENNKNGVLKNR